MWVVLQITPYVVHPPRTGGDHRSHGLVTEFPSAGDRVTRFCQGGSPDVYRALDFRRRVEIGGDYVEYRHLNPVHDAAMAAVLLGYSNVFASAALRFTSGPLGRLLDDADVALVRGPWQMPEIIRRAPPDLPVVYSSHNVEVERFETTFDGPLAGWMRERVERIERRAVEQSDAVVCTGEHDAEQYAERFDLTAPVVVAPNGTYEASLREHRPDSPAARELREAYDIPDDAVVCLFVGSAYGPNVEAAEAVVDLARETRDRDPPHHYLVVGGVGDELASAPPNVTVTGFVDRFEAHFDLADVALNPMRSGGGTNIKLIDYFARSLPVVSTPFGVRGVETTDGEHVVVADVGEFPDAVAALGSDPTRRRQMGERARRLAAERYTWEAASRHLRERLHELFGPF